MLCTLLEKFKNLPANFWETNVPNFYQQCSCSKVQKYYLRNPETSPTKARNNPEKLRENKKSAAFSGDRTDEPWV